MSETIVVLCNENDRLNEALAYALEGVVHERIKSAVSLPRLGGNRVLFAIGLSEHGLDAEVIALIAAQVLVVRSIATIWPPGIYQSVWHTFSLKSSNDSQECSPSGMIFSIDVESFNW